MRGDWATARERGDRIQRLVDAIFATPIRDYRARCKEVLVMQGVLGTATCARRSRPVGPEDRQRLKQALEEAGEL